MASTRAHVVTLSVAVLGGLVGGAVAFAVSARRAVPPAPPTTAPPATTLVVQQLIAAPPNAAEAQPPAPASGAAAAGSAPAEGIESPEVAQARVAQEHEAEVERHREEPYSAWGRRAESQFREDLLRISKKTSFEIVDLDCRTSTCAGTLKFASATAAQTGWLKVATNRYANNCGSEVLIDKVETDRASVFFDCGDESP
jgi:hypothetical protein